MIGEGLQHRTAGVLSQACHPVLVTAVLTARAKVYPISRMDGWILIKVVVGPQQDPTPISHSYCIGDVLGMRDVEETSGHPGNQVLQIHMQIL